VHTVHAGPATGLVGVVALLGALAWSQGLGASGWQAGLAAGVVCSAVLARGLAQHGNQRLGAADWVTLVRAILVAGVAALVVDSVSGTGPRTALVSLAAVALVLDGLDGWVARRTGTASALGARFDMEVDAFLILVLSVLVARAAGPWVLAIGMARYAFLAAGWVAPWLRAPLPPRYWRKVVAAVQGIVLTVAASGVLPSPLTDAALVTSLALLAESFGRDVWFLWRHRPPPPSDRAQPGRPTAVASEDTSTRRPGGSSPWTGRAATVAVPPVTLRAWAVLAAVGLLWSALLVPDRIGSLGPARLLQIPVEAVVFVAVALALPSRARSWTASLAGGALGLAVLLKVGDLAFSLALGRTFDAVGDVAQLGAAASVLSHAAGRAVAVAGLALGGLLLLGLVLAMVRSARQVAGAVGRHQAGSVRALAALGIAWTLCAGLGLQTAPGEPVADSGAVGIAYQHVVQVRNDRQEQRVFADAAARDRFAATPSEDLLVGLRGKDVLVAFVESYGRVAVQGRDTAPVVGRVLDRGTARLRAAGFSARSGYLTSPTFGGLSWLAHSTLQTGLWVDNQRRYDALVAGTHLTLTGAFRKAGWRTVCDDPANRADWPEATSFYHCDQVYDARNVGYAGPGFGYAPMPDQYTLAAFQRRELAPRDRPPVMAEIDLVSSHAPWAPLPRLVGWDAVGDGSVFEAMPREGDSRYAVWRDPVRVHTAYAQSIAYSMEALISFVETFPDDRLVLLLVGDHQPAAVVSGSMADHDVPVTLVAHDPSVMERIAGWQWNPGLRPRPDAPVWPMSAFRDRFLAAFGPGPASIGQTVVAIARPGGR
jgi:phosphatidylglycerophosphate synthase